MDINDLYSLFSNGVTPLAFIIYLIISGNKRDEKFGKTIEELRKTVENNTIIITRLYDKIKGGET